MIVRYQPIPFQYVKDTQKAERGEKVLNTGNYFYCTRDFKQGGALDDGSSKTSFCLEWNGKTFQDKHGTPRYLAFCEGGEDGHNCKAICNGEGQDTGCRETVSNLNDAMTKAFLEGPNASPAWNVVRNGKTYYWGRFDKYNNKDYPFSARMVSELNNKYNICERRANNTEIYHNQTIDNVTIKCE